jgi:hypothetical protein
MTSKEKAIALVDKFENLVKINESQIELTERRSKQCALICVDEIMDIFDKWEEKQDDFVLSYGTIYWQEVKKEIEKL